jgi:hypothetical protein
MPRKLIGVRSTLISSILKIKLIGDRSKIACKSPFRGRLGLKFRF